MRYKKAQKEETRRKMLNAVGRGFRRWGFSGIGVDGLAKAADVTSGAFYSHFGSKIGAFHAALAAGLDEVIAVVPKLQEEHGAEWVGVFAEYYLGPLHRKDLECGCAMAALTSEVVRSSRETQAVFEEKMTTIAELMLKGLTGPSNEDRRARAWALLSILIGGVSIARAMESDQAAEEVAASVKTAAIQVAGKTCAVA